MINNNLLNEFISIYSYTYRVILLCHSLLLDHDQINNL